MQDADQKEVLHNYSTATTTQSLIRSCHSLKYLRVNAPYFQCHVDMCYIMLDSHRNSDRPNFSYRHAFAEISRWTVLKYSLLKIHVKKIRWWVQYQNVKLTRICQAWQNKTSVSGFPTIKQDSLTIILNLRNPDQPKVCSSEYTSNCKTHKSKKIDKIDQHKSAVVTPERRFSNFKKCSRVLQSPALPTAGCS